ncbi:hypothetical protein XELAEV_18018574mg [Xenopus laevis]|uniref:Metalloendopeptidase n=1 Tax=Xenopus laevis TaxID=8355 RepID=A0A974HTP0_XENLA|nr:hypothetical protein XELAEV_18018574mg [Xenopus laevis]
MEGDIIKEKKSIRTFSPRVGKWPKINGSVIIPYTLSPSYENIDRNIILKAFWDLQASTCLRFVERTTEKDYISIEPSFGCFSSVGRVGGMQLVSLAFECLRTNKGKGIALHELMHVAGFWHEHSRADRDDYIWIMWDEIVIGYEKNFCKYDTTNMLVKYELQSILHYPRNAFGKSGQTTINPKYPYSKTEIGQREKLSASDILRVNKLYSCSQYTPSTGKPQNSYCDCVTVTVKPSIYLEDMSLKRLLCCLCCLDYTIDDDELMYFAPIFYPCTKEKFNEPTSTDANNEQKTGSSEQSLLKETSGQIFTTKLKEIPGQIFTTEQTPRTKPILSQIPVPTTSFETSAANEGTVIARHGYTTLLSSVNHGTSLLGEKVTFSKDVTLLNMTGKLQTGTSTDSNRSPTNSSQSLKKQLQETQQKPTMSSEKGLFTSVLTAMPTHVINLSSPNAFSSQVNLSAQPISTENGRSGLLNQVTFVNVIGDHQYNRVNSETALTPLTTAESGAGLNVTFETKITFASTETINSKEVPTSASTPELTHNALFTHISKLGNSADAGEASLSEKVTLLGARGDLQPVTTESIKIHFKSNFSQLDTTQKTLSSLSTLPSLTLNTVELTHNDLFLTTISPPQHLTEDKNSILPEQVTLFHVNKSVQHGTPTKSNQILPEKCSTKPTLYPPDQLDYSTNSIKSDGKSLISGLDTTTLSKNLVLETQPTVKSMISTSAEKEISSVEGTGSPSLSMTLMYNKMNGNISVSTYSSPNGISTSTLSQNTVRGEQNRSMLTALADLSGHRFPGLFQDVAYEWHNKADDHHGPEYHDKIGKRSLNEPLPVIKSISPVVSHIKRETEIQNSHIRHSKFNARRHRTKLQHVHIVKHPKATFLNSAEGSSLSRISRDPQMDFGEKAVNSDLASVEHTQFRKFSPRLSPLHNRLWILSTKLSHRQQACRSDHGFCEWKQRKDDRLIWNLIWGRKDHFHGGRTTKDKHKGLLLSVHNFSLEPIPEQKALLVSPVLHLPKCLSFWYRFLPNSIGGTLNVYSRPTNMIGTWTLLWTNQGQENLGWSKAQIQFKKQHRHKNLQIIMEGVAGPSAESNIRIENLYVGRCR